MNGEIQEVKAEAASKVNPLQRQSDECGEEDNLFAPDDEFGAFEEDAVMGVMYRKVCIFHSTPFNNFCTIYSI